MVVGRETLATAAEKKSDSWKRQAQASAAKSVSNVHGERGWGGVGAGGGEGVSRPFTDDGAERQRSTNGTARS